MIRESRSSGVSLIEIIITLAIMAVLLMNLNLPSFSRSVKSKAADSVMADIITAVSMARQAAVYENTMVTFCRSDDGQHCQGKWSEGSIIFTDKNADRVLNGGDRLLYRLQEIGAEGELTFNSFRNRQYLQMTPRGFTNYQNGNFTFCPDDGDPSMIRQVIVSLTGRTRRARDNDGDGIVENSRGEDLTCD